MILAQRTDRLSISSTGICVNPISFIFRQSFRHRIGRSNGDHLRRALLLFVSLASRGNFVWFEQAVFFHPFAEWKFRQVMLAGIANDKDDDRASSASRRRNAAAQFVPVDPPQKIPSTRLSVAPFQTIAIADVPHLVQRIADARWPAEPPGPSLQPGMESSGELFGLFDCPVNRSEMDRRRTILMFGILLFQEFSGAGDCSTRADAGNKSA